MFYLKKTLWFFVLVLLTMPVIALPAITELLPTSNGQYVYYRDYSFTSETYIGFLQYDKNTYAIKYIAPHPAKGLPLIELIVTIDPENDHLVLTGEKIVSKVTNEDTDAMNYLHDLLYELTARRQKVNEEDFTQPVTRTEEYTQFGGQVTLTYNAIIPLFNLESIKTEDNSILLEAVVIGQISADTDINWDSFAGIPDTLPKLSENSSVEISETDYKNLNSQWIQKMNNFYFLGDNALMFFSDVKTSERLSLLRYFLLSTDKTTVYYKNHSLITKKDGSILLSSIIKGYNTETYKIDIKILSQIKENYCTIKGFTIYNDFYLNNLAYFNKLIKDNTKF